jgi:hypothetical protein
MKPQHQVHDKDLHKRGPDWRQAGSGHTCGWPGCEEFIAGRLWGCRDHWMQVPMELRDEYMLAGAGRSWNDLTPLHAVPAVIAVDLKINMWLLH